MSRFRIGICTDYGRPERKKPSLHGRKFTPTPKFLGMAEAYFVRLPHWPIFSGIFDLCLHGVSVVRAHIALHVIGCTAEVRKKMRHVLFFLIKIFTKSLHRGSVVCNVFAWNCTSYFIKYCTTCSAYTTCIWEPKTHDAILI